MGETPAEPTRYSALARLIRGLAKDDGPDAPLPSAEFKDGDLAIECSLAQIAPFLIGWPDTPKFLREALRLGPPIEKLTPPRPGFKLGGGKADELPIYYALCMQPVPATEAAGRVAQAAVLLAAAILYEDIGVGAFVSSMRLACRAVRQIGSNTHAHPEFIHALAQVKSGRGVLKAIESVGARPLVLTVGQATVLLKIRVFLRDAFEGRMPRDGVERKSRPKPPVAPDVVGPDVPGPERGEPEKPPGGGEPENRPKRPPAARRVAEVDDLVAEHSIREDATEGLPSADEVSEAAASSAESPRRSTVAVNVPLNVPAHFVSSRQVISRAKFAARAIATSAQSLMLAGDRLQLIDLEAAERYATGLRSRAFRPPSEGVSQGAIVAAAMLITGLSADGLSDLKVVEQLAHVPERPDAPYLVVSDEVLVIPGPQLVDGFVPRSADQEHYRSVAEQLVLKLPRELAWIQLLMEFAGRHVGGSPFSDPECAGQVSLFVSAVNDRFGSRLTPSRISQFQARQLFATSGDRADVALLFGGKADARLYYYAPAVAHVLRCHQSIWKGVLKSMGLSVESDPADKNHPLPWAERPWHDGQVWSEPADPYVGSQCCPTDRGVAAMVEAMINHCRTTLTGRRDKARTRQVHNALVAYTCQMVMWHTGIRAVTDPVELGLYDHASGMLSVSDKNTDSYYASRVVWVPPIAQRQIAAYLEHLVEFKKSYKQSDKKPDKQVFENLASRGNTLFFVDEDDAPTAVRVEILRQQVPQGHVYPMNAQRHYLRTRLRELGVPAQTIDALLGHGARGEEPYAKHSCYSAARLRSDLEMPLQHLSEQAGWTVLHGLKS